MTNDDLTYAMRECAFIFAGLGIEYRPEIFTRAVDGLDIPPGTQIEVIIRLVHMPDITPVLDMDFIPT